MGIKIGTSGSSPLVCETNTKSIKENIKNKNDFMNDISAHITASHPVQPEPVKKINC